MELFFITFLCVFMTIAFDAIILMVGSIGCDENQRVPYTHNFKNFCFSKNRILLNPIMKGILVALLSIAYGVFLIAFYLSFVLAFVIVFAGLLVGEVFSLIFLKQRYFVHNVLIRKYKERIFYKKANFDGLRDLMEEQSSLYDNQEIFGYVIVPKKDYKGKNDDILCLNFKMNRLFAEEKFEEVCEFHYSKENKCWVQDPINTNLKERWIKSCQKIL